MTGSLEVAQGRGFGDHHKRCLVWIFDKAKGQCEQMRFFIVLGCGKGRKCSSWAGLGSAGLGWAGFRGGQKWLDADWDEKSEEVEVLEWFLTGSFEVAPG